MEFNTNTPEGVSKKSKNSHIYTLAVCFPTLELQFFRKHGDSGISNSTCEKSGSFYRLKLQKGIVNVKFHFWKQGKKLPFLRPWMSQRLKQQVERTDRELASLVVDGGWQMVVGSGVFKHTSWAGVCVYVCPGVFRNTCKQPNRQSHDFHPIPGFYAPDLWLCFFRLWGQVLPLSKHLCICANVYLQFT